MEMATARWIQCGWPLAGDLNGALSMTANLGNCRQQHLRVRMLRYIKEGGLVGDLNDAAEVHYGDPIAQPFNHTEVVADEYAGNRKALTQIRE